MVNSINLLTREEALLIEGKIFELRDKWIERYNPFFYTIGAANWLDIQNAGSVSNYRRVMEVCNPILKKEFSFLHEKVVDCLFKYLGERVKLTDTFGLPGFHIFLSHPQLVESDRDMLMQEWYISKLLNPKTASSPIHYDDFGNLNEGKNTISFTLPISLPSSKTGLNAWDITRHDTVGLPINKERAAVLSSPKTFYPYSIGRLFIHSGDIYHQPVFMSEYKEGESRITLQGHAVLHERTWTVYW